MRIFRFDIYTDYCIFQGRCRGGILDTGFNKYSGEERGDIDGYGVSVVMETNNLKQEGVWGINGNLETNDEKSRIPIGDMGIRQRMTNIVFRENGISEVVNIGLIYTNLGTRFCLI